METIISILVAIVGGLAFLLFRKSKENTQLKADKSLTDQEKDSKVVDERVRSAQEEVEILSQEMEKPVKEGFWEKYTRGKSSDK